MTSMRSGQGDNQTLFSGIFPGSHADGTYAIPLTGHTYVCDSRQTSNPSHKPSRNPVRRYLTKHLLRCPARAPERRPMSMWVEGCLFISGPSPAGRNRRMEDGGFPPITVEALRDDQRKQEPGGSILSFGVCPGASEQEGILHDSCCRGPD